MKKQKKKRENLRLYLIVLIIRKLTYQRKYTMGIIKKLLKIIKVEKVGKVGSSKIKFECVCTPTCPANAPALFSLQPNLKGSDSSTVY